jgi:hypothetical protein
LRIFQSTGVAMEIEVGELFGLPAHPLIVHAVVVLLPLAAVGALVCAAVPRGRRPYAPLVLAAAVAALVSVILAEGSGEELEDRVDKSDLVHDHTEMGEQVLPWAIAEVVVAGGVLALPYVEERRRGEDRRRARPAAMTAIAVVLALGLGAPAVVTVIRAGHSGAKAAWDDVERRDGDRGDRGDRGGDHGGDRNRGPG